MLKSSRWIQEQCEHSQMIAPFIAHSVRQGVISYGLGPYGYDIRLDRAHKRPRASDRPLDPHHVREEDFDTLSEEPIRLASGHYILGRSLEYFRMPKKILGIAFGKSTYARCGVIVNVTPLEPEWSGYLTISIANSGPQPVTLYPGEGIAQVVFLESDDFPVFSYKDLQGKYNGQSAITLAKIQGH